MNKWQYFRNYIGVHNFVFGQLNSFGNIYDKYRKNMIEADDEKVIKELKEVIKKFKNENKNH